jgi:hypothetical protein
MDSGCSSVVVVLDDCIGGGCNDGEGDDCYVTLVLWQFL